MDTRWRSGALLLALPLLLGAVGSSALSAVTAALPRTRTLTIPGTTVTLDLIEVPADVAQGDGGSGEVRQGGGSLWVGRTEVTWDQYDIFVYGLDRPAEVAAGTDAVARPSKPYVPPDRGFGHAGYPAVGMSHRAAEAFCEWLTALLFPPSEQGRTSARFRLPTEEEWARLALAGDKGLFACEVEPECLLEHAWFAENSDRSTKPVATRKPNALGLHDVHGNVAEWVRNAHLRPTSATTPTADPLPGSSGAARSAPAAPATTAPDATAPDATAPAPRSRPAPTPVAKGGSYLDSAAQCAVDVDLRQTSAWNQSDPQIPKSAWWLADCSFVGFRVVLEVLEEPAEPAVPAVPAVPATPAEPAKPAEPPAQATPMADAPATAASSPTTSAPSPTPNSGTPGTPGTPGTQPSP